MPRTVFARVTLALLAVAALALVVYSRSRTAPMPPVFAERLTLRAAAAAAERSGKPVLVFATADWCGPCQSFKRTTLVDPGVEALITAQFVPVYLDVDLEQDAAAAFSIISLPSSIVLRDGRPVSKIEGAVGAEEYAAFLRAALSAPPAS